MNKGLKYSECKAIMNDPKIIQFVDEIYDLFPGQVQGFGVKGFVGNPELTISFVEEIETLISELTKEVFDSGGQRITVAYEIRPRAILL